MHNEKEIYKSDLFNFLIKQNEGSPHALGTNSHDGPSFQENVDISNYDRTVINIHSIWKFKS